MPKRIGGSVLNITVDATAAGYDQPAIIVPASGVPFWTEMTGNRILTARPQPKEPFPGYLKAISGVFTNAAGLRKRGQIITPFVMPDQTSIVLLDALETLQGMLNPAVRWTGDIPIGYGYGLVCFSAITLTDIFQISAMYEVDYE